MLPLMLKEYATSNGSKNLLQRNIKIRLMLQNKNDSLLQIKMIDK